MRVFCARKACDGFRLITILKEVLKFLLQYILQPIYIAEVSWKENMDLCAKVWEVMELCDACRTLTLVQLQIDELDGESIRSALTLANHVHSSPQKVHRAALNQAKVFQKCWIVSD